MKSRNIIIFDLLILCVLTSCQIRQFYPTGGAILGGGAGALTGSPLIAGMSAGTGAMLGEMAKGNAELKEAQETITALTHGDVEKLVSSQMSSHRSLFDDFTAYIKRILLIAAICLGAYLAIPIFVAKKCSKDEAMRNLTRPPFPPKNL